METVATVNVNGIRAAWRKGMQPWLEETTPDFVTLQEVRAPAGMVADLFGDGWHVAHDASEIPGRAGVAVASVAPMNAVRIGLGSGLVADTGRWVEADVDLVGQPVTLISAYIHSGQVGTIKQDEKFAFLELVTARLRDLMANGTEFILSGDLNIAHREVDLKNFKANVKVAGFLPEERAYLDRWFDEIGLIDLGRHLGGPGPGPYTWWSQRGRAFDNDAGWRIDYQIASPGIAARACTASVHRAPSWDTRWSDHAPLVIEYA